MGERDRLFLPTQQSPEDLHREWLNSYEVGDYAHAEEIALKVQALRNSQPISIEN
jgi:hypothetical protein